MASNSYMEYQVRGKEAFDLPLVDGDLVLYKAGFSANRTEYTHPELGGVIFNYKKEAQAACALSGHDPNDIMSHENIEPVSHAIHNLKKLITTISENTGGNEPIIFLSGPSEENFRYTVAPEYKGNRTGRKPAHFEELKEYVLKNYKTVVSEGCEADDMLYPAANAATLRGHSAVICSTDKDLLTVPGSHYNWDNDKFMGVDFDQAETNFARQMVVGDTSDNVGGVPGKGPVFAQKNVRTTQDAKEIYYRHFDPVQATREWNKNAQLLWIWRKMPDECPHLALP